MDALRINLPFFGYSSHKESCNARCGIYEKTDTFIYWSDADNYLNWEFIGGVGAYFYYENPGNKLQYAFDLPGSISDYYDKKLSGEEICMGIAGEVGYFFPNSVWPQNITDTLDFVRFYLGLDFEVINDDSTESGCWYSVELVNNNCIIRLYSENGIITNETGMLVYGEGIILE